MVTRWFVEYEPYAARVLGRHWPGIPVYGDIFGIDWRDVEPIDVLAGGFPCQPISVAGRGRAQDDDRWLWPEFARAIRDLRPRYVLVENSRNLLAVSRGSAFAEILSDLAESGYDAEWDCIPAVAAGAPHERDRLWLIAYRAEFDGALAHGHDGRSLDAIRAGRDAVRDGGASVADAYGKRSRRQPHPAAGHERDGDDARRKEASRRIAERRSHVANPASVRHEESRQPLFAEHSASLAEWSAAQSLDAGWWSTEPDVGRVAHGIPSRVDRLRCVGNAVVPQVVEWIGRRIIEHAGSVTEGSNAVIAEEPAA